MSIIERRHWEGFSVAITTQMAPSEWRDPRRRDRFMIFVIFLPRSIAFATYNIDEKIVGDEKIQGNTAKNRPLSNDDFTEADVDYYLNPPQEQNTIPIEILVTSLQPNEEITEDEEPIWFPKEGKNPVTMLFNIYQFGELEHFTPEESPKIISFDNVEASVESSCPFIFNTSEKGACFRNSKVPPANNNIELIEPLKVEKNVDNTHTLNVVDSFANSRSRTRPEIDSAVKNGTLSFHSQPDIIREKTERTEAAFNSSNEDSESYEFYDPEQSQLPKTTNDTSKVYDYSPEPIVTNAILNQSSDGINSSVEIKSETVPATSYVQGNNEQPINLDAELAECDVQAVYFRYKNTSAVDSEPPHDIQEENDAVTDLYKEESIDERGGRLFLREADISLHVPAGALTRRHLIRLTVPMDPRSWLPDHPPVSPRVTPLTILEPDNLIFRIPVTLTLPHCAVIRDPGDHEVNVQFGYRDDNSKDMRWEREEVRWYLDEHYCSVFLNHFTGVDVGITTREIILRIIPYAQLRRNKNKLTFNVWICQDVDTYFQAVVHSEDTNSGIPLDSYDTFQLNCFPESEDSDVKVTLRELEESSWQCEDSENTIHVSRFFDSTKSKISFLLRPTDEEDDTSYMYVRLRVTQTSGQEERETTFVIRKRTCDLKLPVSFKTRYCQYENEIDQPSATEKRTRTCTAAVYMDPVRDFKDDVILTLWLCPFDSNSEEFQILQEEQKLQLRHRVGSENSVSVFDDNGAVVSKTRFLNGEWVLSPEEKKIEADRIRSGSRAKFQFIGHRKQQIEIEYIDLEVEVFQKDKYKTKFMTDVEIDDLLYESRRRKIDGESRRRNDAIDSVANASSIFPNEVQTGTPLQLGANSLPTTNTVQCVNGSQDVPLQLKASSNALHSQKEDRSVNSEEYLRKCFMFLKKKLIKEWKDCGRYLGLKEEIVDTLNKGYKDDEEECVYQMFRKWQQTEGPRATFEKLIEVVGKLERSDLVNQLKEMARMAFK